MRVFLMIELTTWFVLDAKCNAWLIKDSKIMIVGNE